MRPPYGAINPKLRKDIKSLGYRPVMWDAHVWDWESPAVSEMVSDMKAANKPGLNLLLHDGGGDRTNTVAAVTTMLPKWQKDGYRFESLPKCRAVGSPVP